MLKRIDPKEIGQNVFSLIGDQWMLITAGSRERCNTMTASWGGLGVIWGAPAATCYIRPQRYTKEFVDREEYFTLCFFGEEYRKALSLCGSKSGRDVDKFAACGLHAAPGSVLTDCPILEESPVNLECKVTQVIPLGSHDLFLAEVVACDVDESLLDEKGKLCLDKANLIVYSHGEYLALGKKLGTFGYSVRKKKPAKRKKQ